MSFFTAVADNSRGGFVRIIPHASRNSRRRASKRSHVIDMFLAAGLLAVLSLVFLFLKA